MLGRARILLMIVMLIPFAASATNELPLPEHRQDIRVWDWAAAVAIVVGHTIRVELRDCQIISAYERMLGAPGTCCDDPLACLRGGTPEEISFVLRSVYGVPTRHLARPLEMSEVAAEIEAGRPIIATLRQGDSNSAVVIVGYSGSRHLTIFDPVAGKSTLSYQTLRGHPTLGRWSDSVTYAGSSLPAPQPHVMTPPKTQSPPERGTALPTAAETRPTSHSSPLRARPPHAVPTAPWLLFPNAHPFGSGHRISNSER